MSQIYKLRQTKKPLNPLTFRAAIFENLKKIAECVSEKKFVDLFSSLNIKPTKLCKLHKSFLQDLHQNLNNALNNVINDGEVFQGFDKLSKLVDNIIVNGTAWRPPGDVKLHMRSLDVKKIKKESNDLKHYVSQLEGKNVELIKKISKKRKKLEATQKLTTKILNRTTLQLPHLERRKMVKQEYINDIYMD